MANQQDPYEKDCEEETEHDDQRGNGASVSLNLQLDSVLAVWVDRDWVKARAALIGALRG